MQLSQIDSISQFLNLELRKRCQKNTGYSLRAFARDLDISPSRLSEVLKHETGLSEAKAQAIAEHLKLRPRTRDFWINLTRAHSARSPQAREYARLRLEELKRAEEIKVLREDEFQVISEWYYGALMELPQLADFRDDPQWMAQRLGLSLDQVQVGIERLIRMGLLGRDELGRLRTPTEPTEAFTEVPSAAIRKSHRQMLGCAIQSLLNDPMEEREFNSMTLAVPTSRMPQFKSEIKKFMKSFLETVGDEEKQEIYALSIQFFPLRAPKSKS